MIAIIFTAIGGTVGILTFIMWGIKFYSDRIAERLIIKYELKMNKELEYFKRKLEKNNYISQSRFDLEFNIYKDISEMLYIAVEKCYWLFPTQIDYSPQGKNEINIFYQKRYDNAVESIVGVQRVLGSKAPFISEELFNRFENLKQLLTTQVNMYPICGAIVGCRGTLGKELNDELNKSFLRTDEIKTDHKALIDKMRFYFDSLIIKDEK